MHTHLTSDQILHNKFSLSVISTIQLVFPLSSQLNRQYDNYQLIHNKFFLSVISTIQMVSPLCQSRKTKLTLSQYKMIRIQLRTARHGSTSLMQAKNSIQILNTHNHLSHKQYLFTNHSPLALQHKPITHCTCI